MSRENLIQPKHLTRTATVYVRQSTTKQVVQNQESTRRQYQLAETAQRLGWPKPRVEVIDDDLGMSGASSSGRFGFQKLIAAISLGEVGIVLVTEVSRLSRLNSDWHRVIELCAVFETLIADEDGLYDPRDPNDRLVLGLKGTLFSAELHILRARMQGGLLNKARRGELALHLPVGFRRLTDHTVIQDPDEQVRTSLHTIFDQFAVLKSARAVQRYFIEHQLQMPRYVQFGPDAGRLYWVKPAYQMIQQVLTNPVYAGIFVYGRRVLQTDPGDPPRARLHRRPKDEWEIVVPGVYPGFITQAQYEANRAMLEANQYNFVKRRRGAPREGPGLLVGIIICGRCGRRMTPSYGSDYNVYHCRLERMTYDVRQCQSFSMRYLDEAVRNLFFEVIQPGSVDTILSALEMLEQERQVLDRQWQLKLERARYAVRLAERQYDAVDPENRLVARELEKRWNDALQAMRSTEQEYAKARRTELAPLTGEEQSAVRQLASDLPAVWDAPTTTATDRKRLIRLVIQDVTVTAKDTNPRTAEIAILWGGGMATRHTVSCRPTGWHCKTDPLLVEKIRSLAQRLPDHRIAERLNAEGLCTKTGKAWTYPRVRSMRKQHGIATACPIDPGIVATRSDGLTSASSVAKRLGISPSLVHVWIRQGVLRSEQRTRQSYRWVQLMDDDLARLDGEHDWSQFPKVRQVMQKEGLSREMVWDLVRNGQYVAYRHRVGRSWEWRLRRVGESPARQESAISTDSTCSVDSGQIIT